MDDAALEQLAAKLTDAQRRLICGDTGYVRWATYQKLIKMGLLYQVGGFMCRTDLGKALRAFLTPPQPEGE